MVSVRLEPGDGRSNPAIARAHLEIQRSIYRIGALAIYGVPNPKKLTLQDRHALQVQMWLRSGSTEYGFDLSKPWEYILQRARDTMTGGQWMIAMIAVGYFFSSSWVEVERLRAQKEIETARIQANGQTEIFKNQLQVVDRSMEQLHEIFQRIPMVHVIAEGETRWRNAILKTAPPAGMITLNGVTIESKVARAIERSAPDRVLSGDTGWETTIKLSDGV